VRAVQFGAYPTEITQEYRIISLHIDVAIGEAIGYANRYQRNGA
jgi:hypothetical protein